MNSRDPKKSIKINFQKVRGTGAVHCPGTTSSLFSTGFDTFSIPKSCFSKLSCYFNSHLLGLGQFHNLRLSRAVFLGSTAQEPRSGPTFLLFQWIWGRQWQRNYRKLLTSLFLANFEKKVTTLFQGSKQIEFKFSYAEKEGNLLNMSFVGLNV